MCPTGHTQCVQVDTRNVARRLDCVIAQVFTKNQQQWKCSPLTEECIREWKTHLKRLKFKKTISHDSYLINLAATNSEFWRKSTELFVEELTRCSLLGIPYLVTHPGAHMGAGEEAGIAKIVAAIDVIHDLVADAGVVTCLEITAGQGTCLGGSFGQFPQIFAQVEEQERLRVCLDTCHVFVAGYDLRTPEATKATWDEFDAGVGLGRLCCIHANDAQKGLGSKVDRHAHVGEGCIGDAGFAALLADPRLPGGLPVIVETPEAETCHRRNVWRLRQLAKA